MHPARQARLCGRATQRIFVIIASVEATLVLLTILAQSAGMKFVKIPAGEFMMGCSSEETPYLPDGTYQPCNKIAQPAHRVRITKAFEMGEFEVTQAQWESEMGDNPSFFKGPDRPVEQVSWDSAQEFLQRLNARDDGYHYRLPTEAEWEYAARAGSSTEFPDSPPPGEIAWFGAGGKNLLESKGETHPVGSKKPNAWGLYDMRGNVGEWVQDWISADWTHDDYYSKSPVDDPQGPLEGKYHVTRGGSWYSNASYLRASNRYPCACTARRDIGFRVVRVQSSVLP